MTHRTNRRQFLGLSLLAASALPALGKAAMQVTPAQIEGPFYPLRDQADKDADLTRIKGHDQRASGEVVIISGQVSNAQGVPIADAVVDLWQANSHGRYSHERDPNPAPLDPDFQGWAILRTDAHGQFRCRTIRPGAYPVSEEWSRPPHIHFKVSRRGYREITTQMYFEDEPLNDSDRLLNELSADEQNSVIARILPGDASDFATQFRFDVVLKSV